MSDVRYVRPSGVSGSIAEHAGPAARDNAEDAEEYSNDDNVFKEFKLVNSFAFSAMHAAGMPASSAILPETPEGRTHLTSDI